MGEVELRFDPSGIEGIVPTGTYLSAAAKRFGVRILECDLELREHDCIVDVSKGAHLLSAVSDSERELLNGDSGNNGRRLACFTRLEKTGEVVVMTKQKDKDDEKAAEKVESEDYKKAFADMPLEKKFSNLVELEAMALNETISFVFNSPYKVADKFMDVLAEFGFAKHEEERKATRPDETAGKDAGSDTKSAPEGKRTQAEPKSSGDEAAAV